MDYKNIYQESFDKTISDVTETILKDLKSLKSKNKNVNNLCNKYNENLNSQKEEIENKIKNKYPDLFISYQNAVNEYDSNHVLNFIQFDFPSFLNKYTDAQLKKVATDLGVHKAFSKASINFANSREYLHYAYKLNKYYDAYSLNFDDQSSNPVNKIEFEKMKDELFPNLNPVKDNKIPDSKPIKKESTAKTNLTQKEKLYLAFLLYELTVKRSGIGKSEFIRIIILLENTFMPEMLSTKKISNFTEYKNLNQLKSNMSIIKKKDFLQRLESKAIDLNLDVIQGEIGKKILDLKNHK
jgi:hypothetical protein